MVIVIETFYVAASFTPYGGEAWWQGSEIRPMNPPRVVGWGFHEDWLVWLTHLGGEIIQGN